MTFLLGAWALLKRIPWQLWFAVAMFAAVYGAKLYHERAIEDAAEQAGIAATDKAMADIAATQAAADIKALEGVVATITEQNAIAQETSNALEQATDDIDARARALGVQHDKALARIAANRVNLPTAGGDAGQPQEAPPADGLPWSVALPLMTQAQKNLAQLNAILDFEEAQAALAAKEKALANPTPD